MIVDFSDESLHSGFPYEAFDADGNSIDPRKEHLICVIDTVTGVCQEYLKDIEGNFIFDIGGENFQRSELRFKPPIRIVNCHGGDICER